MATPVVGAISPTWVHAYPVGNEQAVAVLESDRDSLAALDISSNDDALTSLQRNDLAVIAQEPISEGTRRADAEADDTPATAEFDAAETAAVDAPFAVRSIASPQATDTAGGADSTSDARTHLVPVSPPNSPRQYRPPRSAPPRSTGKRAPRVEPAAKRELRLDVAVRLVFEHGGFCRLSLIPEKDERLDGSITALGASEEVELVPLQDNFYSDVFPSDVGTVLLHGLEWTATPAGGAPLRWSLAGREIYVLGEHEHVSGYLSTPRVLLGAKHVVLCTNARAEQVAEIVNALGTPATTVIGEADGLPAGWTGLSGVVPSVAIPQSSDHDILNILRPRPDVAIVLDGGIRIGRSTWLAEYPPQIRVRGDMQDTRGVQIDGVAAARTEAGMYVVTGYDSVGEHVVWCADHSRNYEIRPGLEAWTGWDAYRWSLEGVGADGMSAQPSLCGALIRGPRSAASDSANVVATRNPVLLGAMPGEIARANTRGTLRGTEGLATVPFEPVWALPADPLHCDKRTGRVVALTRRVPRATTGQEKRARRAWCDAILDAARKQLQIEPDDPECATLWASYRRLAKTLRKHLR